MAYLKGICVATTVMVLIFGIVLLDTVEAANTKIAYKKSISGKSPQVSKEKQWPKTMTQENNVNTTSLADSTSTTNTTVVPTATALSHTPLDSIEQPQIDENKSEVEPIEDIAIETDEDPEPELSADYSTAEPEIEEVAVAAEIATATTAATPLKTTETKSNKNNNLPVPCTCGVFLNSQFKRGSNMQPHGKPVISNEQDRIYPCNAIGQKQCQTKCLETMVQHLPNSANILCATLDRDCRKERAYLFVKNCRNHWVNTNLAAGREYCCKNGKSYQCPLI